MASGHVQFKGGQRLEKLFREAGKGGVKQVEVGFFESAKYQDGTPVAAVAAMNEFGTGPHTIRPKTKRLLAFTGADGKRVLARSVRHPGTQERPFFRQAVAQMQDGVAAIVRAGIDAEKMVVDDHLANEVGTYAAAEVKESISQLTSPPNAPSTIAQKGSSNPLIDIGFMRASVSYRVGGAA